MLMKLRTLILLTCIVFCSNLSFAQSADTTLVQIETRDGNVFFGHIVDENEDQIILQTEMLGELNIPRLFIKSKKVVFQKQIKGGELWSDNPQSTRYFWAPNAYGLKKGEGYYQNIYVLWNQFTYGITNNISLGAGVIPTFLFAGAPTPIFGTVKFSIPIVEDKFNLGGGAIAGTVVGEDVGGFGILYGVSTYGSPDNNVTLGLGYGFAEGEWASSPVVNLSGLFRVSSRGYFITENYWANIENENVVIISLGGRWIIKKAALDFTLAIPFAADMDTFIAIPLIGFSIPFGKKQQ